MPQSIVYVPRVTLLVAPHSCVAYLNSLRVRINNRPGEAVGATDAEAIAQGRHNGLLGLGQFGLEVAPLLGQNFHFRFRRSDDLFR